MTVSTRKFIYPLCKIFCWLIEGDRKCPTFSHNCRSYLGLIYALGLSRCIDLFLLWNRNHRVSAHLRSSSLQIAHRYLYTTPSSYREWLWRTEWNPILQQRTQRDFPYPIRSAIPNQPIVCSSPTYQEHQLFLSKSHRFAHNYVA